MSISENDPKNIAWCRNTFSIIKEGGVYGVPRSGLFFRKNKQGFDLNEVMPWIRGMDASLERGANLPSGPMELRRYQIDDFLCIQRHFKAAGILITDSKQLLLTKKE